MNLLALKLRIRLQNLGLESLFGDDSNSRALKYYVRRTYLNLFSRVSKEAFTFASGGDEPHELFFPGIYAQSLGG